MTPAQEEMHKNKKAARAWRRASGLMPLPVALALVRSSQEDLSHAWARVDRVCRLTDCDPRWGYAGERFLREEGLSEDEIRTVLTWIFAPLSRPGRGKAPAVPHGAAHQLDKEG